MSAQQTENIAKSETVSIGADQMPLVAQLVGPLVDRARDTRRLDRQGMLALLQHAFSLAVFSNGATAGWELVAHPRTDQELIDFTSKGARAGAEAAKRNAAVLAGELWHSAPNWS